MQGKKIDIFFWQRNLKSEGKTVEHVSIEAEEEYLSIWPYSRPKKDLSQDLKLHSYEDDVVAQDKNPETIVSVNLTLEDFEKVKLEMKSLKLDVEAGSKKYSVLDNFLSQLQQERKPVESFMDYFTADPFCGISSQDRTGIVREFNYLNCSSSVAYLLRQVGMDIEFNEGLPWLISPGDLRDQLMNQSKSGFDFLNNFR